MSFSILLVDDDPKLRSMLSDILTTQGYIVSEAANSRAGLQQFTVVQPDLVLLDMTMPNANGLSILRALRQQNSIVGILIVSGWKQSAIITAAMASGADGYLAKPFRLQALLQETQRISLVVHCRRYAFYHHASWQSRRLFD